ncbi:MAG: Immunoglobulin I-set domain protein, partial [Verrucomicrobia bacterium]|nr:Immunoglobulin I-set domain protein [Verrucomicrobiota bacterium]
MKISFSASVQRRLQWFNLPTAVLIALLQRTPIVRVAAAIEEMVVSSPISTILKSFATAAASLGAINSMAGATPLVPSSGTSSGITVTQGVAVSVAYTANSPLGPGVSWAIAGTVPPGLSFSGDTSSTLALNGTPTTPGNFPITIKAFGPNNEEVDYAYTITVQAGGGGTAPAFSTQPSSQTVSAGVNVTFTVAVSGTPPPTIQWKKGGTDISGQTGLSLTLTNVQTSDSATYTAVATNSAG